MYIGRYLVKKTILIIGLNLIFACLTVNFTSAISIWDNLPEKDAGSKEGLPDFGQHCDNWCWVAASANSLWYWAKTGAEGIKFPGLLDNPEKKPGNREWEAISPESKDPKNSDWYDSNDERDNIPLKDQGYLNLLKKLAEAGHKKFCEQGSAHMAQRNFLIRQGLHPKNKRFRGEGKGLVPRYVSSPLYAQYVKELKRCEDVVLKLQDEDGNTHYVTGASWDYDRSVEPSKRTYKLDFHDSANVINGIGQPDHHRNSTTTVDKVEVEIETTPSGNPKPGMPFIWDNKSYQVASMVVTSPEDPPNERSIPKGPSATSAGNISFIHQTEEGGPAGGILSINGLTIQGLNEGGRISDLSVDSKYANDLILNTKIDIDDLHYLTYYEDEGYLFDGGTIRVYDGDTLFLQSDLPLFTINFDLADPCLKSWGILDHFYINPDINSKWLRDFDLDVIHSDVLLADLAIDFQFDIITATNQFSQDASGQAFVSLIGNSPVPEPASMILALCGLGCLAVMRKRIDL